MVIHSNVPDGSSGNGSGLRKQRYFFQKSSYIANNLLAKVNQPPEKLKMRKQIYYQSNRD